MKIKIPTNFKDIVARAFKQNHELVASISRGDRNISLTNNAQHPVQTGGSTSKGAPDLIKHLKKATDESNNERDQNANLLNREIPDLIRPLLYCQKGNIVQHTSAKTDAIQRIPTEEVSEWKCTYGHHFYALAYLVKLFFRIFIAFLKDAKPQVAILSCAFVLSYYL